MTKQVTALAKARQAAEALDAAIVDLHERTAAYIAACQAANAFRLSQRRRPVPAMERPQAERRVLQCLLDDPVVARVTGLVMPIRGAAPLSEAHLPEIGG